MRKAQATPITIFFIVLAFLIGWVMFLGPWLGDQGEAAVTTNSLTGIEAFILMNLNALVFVCLILFIIAALYWGGGG